jgi:hypothetical protein
VKRQPIIERIISMPISHEETLPLSSAQKHIWFLEQLQPDTRESNTSLVFHLSGPLAAEALWAALSDVIARHEVLRTIFPSVDRR